MTAAPCAACQVTLPVFLTLVERADALAAAVAAWDTCQCKHICENRVHMLDALAAYRAGPPAPYTTDDGRPLCPSCFWKSHAA